MLMWRISVEKSVEKKLNPKKIIKTVLDYVVKIAIIALFTITFIGRLNPARISGKQPVNTSLVKSAFFFKNYVSPFVQLDAADSDELENPFGNMSADSSEDSFSYEDFYASFAAMAQEAADAFESESDDDWDDDWDEDSDEGMTFDKAEKIKMIDFKGAWADFESENEEIASGLKKAHIYSIFTYFAIILTLIGLYLIYGTKIIRKIGFIVTSVGSVLTMLSMLPYDTAYNLLEDASMSAFPMAGGIDVAPIAPAGIPVYLIFAGIILVLSVCLLFIKSEDAQQTEQASEKAQLNSFPFQVTFRILALLLFLLLFIPGANPARISENINRNVSLFTSGFSYATYTQNLQRALIRGWLPESVTRLAWISSLFVCIGIIATGVGACMSIGNNKLKRYAHITLLAGTTVSFASLFGILRAYNLICSSPNVDKVLPHEPTSIPLYFIFLAIIFACVIVSFIKTPAPEKDEVCQIDAPLQLFIMLLPCLILVFLFSYLPLWGWRYAFFDYNPGDILSMDSWVGLKWFKAPFENAATRSDILRVLRNTLIMSGLGILGSWLPMAFAIFLSEIKSIPARKVIQTLTTIPNFISWVLVYAIAFCIFGTEGFISSLMVNSGVWDKGKNMLMGSQGIWIKMWLWGVWKSLGWSAIMYIAAISGIDQQLYEAATVDGAGRFQKMWHITLPELLPTYVVLLILSISGILSNGMDQYLVFKNPTNKEPIEVLDLYVYQLTFGSTTNSNIPFSTVVSMFKSLVSVVLLFITNKISKMVRGNSIF
ncbi:MAG: ABC transporter permease subunit [Treponema sp.]|nr:ABC transporter permease subunit [Treponema sp.]